MEQTPLKNVYNPVVLQLMRPDFNYVVEVGTGSGVLAGMYREVNSHCHYVGIELVPEYAQVSRQHCSEVITANIEHFTDEQFAYVSEADCWLFPDVLEHLYDPWELLRKVKRFSKPNIEIIACIPNAQHWIVQSALCSGKFYYADEGLLDKSHIRFFTRQTMFKLFETTGFRVIEAIPRVLKPSDALSNAIKVMANALDTDPEFADKDSWPVQWVMKAVHAN